MSTENSNTGRQTTPHTPSCHWYEQAEDGTESCDCGAAGREATAHAPLCHTQRGPDWFCTCGVGDEEATP